MAVFRHKVVRFLLCEDKFVDNQIVNAVKCMKDNLDMGFASGKMSVLIRTG